MTVSIKTRLAMAMALLASLLVLVGVLGLFGMTSSNDANRETYSNALPSVTYISEVEIVMARQRAALLRAALDPAAPDLDAIIKKSKGFADQASGIWSHYMALSRDAEQDRLAQETESKRHAFSEGLDKFADAIKGGDPKAIMRAALENNDYYAAFTASNEKLKKATFEGAKQTYDSHQESFSRFRLIVLIAIGVGVLSALFAWNNLRRAIGGPLAAALEHFERIADGDLTHRVDAHSRDEMGQMMTGLAKMRESLVKTVEAVRAGSEVIGHATREVAAGNLDLSARTEEQAASLEQTAASMEELSSTVHKNTENAGEAERLSKKAFAAAENGSSVVQRVVGMMNEINDSSGKINDIISIIEGIAFQTNILALNAAVEAARAGEQGRGFAVVASEVRSLAQRSSSAAKEIKLLIEQSVARVEAGSTMVAEAGTSMKDILGSVKNVTDVIQEIAAATVEQSHGIDQVSQAVTQMDEVTQQNAALVEQASAAAQSLEDQARALLDAVSLFKLAHETAGASQVQRPIGRGTHGEPGARRSTTRMAQPA
ncbi:methyl-accepting chemotaxis protein Tar [Pararobbsia alpina]|uniref:methyl-accepting chemotaxis protein n=1 Tax=Pararobbsia alpina TaxID=621374 RepID=UPI0039A4223B